MTERVPLYGKITSGRKKIRGLVIRASDCPGNIPPKHVNDKHREIQRRIDRRKVHDGEVYGWIEYNDREVTDWHVDEELL